MKDVSFSLAFVAGIFSFLSPCVLPLVPAYVSYITGVSLDELRHSSNLSKIIGKVMPNTIAFILGFSTIFISLGASSSLLGNLLIEYQDYIRIGGGILTIIFGLFIAGFLKLDLFMKEKRLHLSKGPTGYIGAFLIGISFAAGWTPCIGPILGTILIYASTQASAGYGLQLLAIYSLGLAIPFIISTLAINIFFSYTRRIHKFMRAVTIFSGLILIIFGIMLLSDRVGQLATLFPNLGIKF